MELKIHINVNNRVLYTFVAIAVIMLFGMGVHAYGSAVPSTMGHSSEEIVVDDVLCNKISGHDCGTDTTIADTNTWRAIDNTAVNGITTESISSNWAYDHDATSDAHHTKTVDTDTDTNTWRAIDDSPANGVTTESISSNWAYDHDATSDAHHTKTVDTDTHLTATSTHHVKTVNTNTWRAIDNTPVNGITAESISSNWAYDHDAASDAHHTKTVDTDTHLTATSTHHVKTVNTNTWRAIDNTPVNGITAESISSNWAYDHDAASDAHHTKTVDTDTDTNTWRPLDDTACNTITGHDCGYDTDTVVACTVTGWADCVTTRFDNRPASCTSGKFFTSSAQFDGNNGQTMTCCRPLITCT